MAIFHFQNSVCLLSWNWSNSFWDIALFWIYKMAAATILAFVNRKTLLADEVQRVETHHLAKFCQNSLVHYGDIAIFWLFKMTAVRHLGFMVHLNHSQRVLGGLYHWTKLGCDQCSSWYGMKVSLFGAFGLKTPICTPKVFWMGYLTP